MGTLENKELTSNKTINADCNVIDFYRSIKSNVSFINFSFLVNLNIRLL